MSDRIEEITAAVGQRFTTFGGGRTSEWNPLATALSDKPLMFAAGVDVRAVVAFVVESLSREGSDMATALSELAARGDLLRRVGQALSPNPDESIVAAAERLRADAARVDFIESNTLARCRDGSDIAAVELERFDECEDDECEDDECDGCEACESPSEEWRVVGRPTTWGYVIGTGPTLREAIDDAMKPVAESLRAAGTPATTEARA